MRTPLGSGFDFEVTHMPPNLQDRRADELVSAEPPPSPENHLGQAVRRLAVKRPPSASVQARLTPAAYAGCDYTPVVPSPRVVCPGGRKPLHSLEMSVHHGDCSVCRATILDIDLHVSEMPLCLEVHS